MVSLRPEHAIGHFPGYILHLTDAAVSLDYDLDVTGCFDEDHKRSPLSLLCIRREHTAIKWHHEWQSVLYTPFSIERMTVLLERRDSAAHKLSNELLTLILNHVEPDTDRAVPVDRRQFLSVESFDAPKSIAIDSVKDICNFRLASRRYAELGAPFLFTRVTTRLSKHGLARLEWLSQHTHLSKHVRKFSYMVPAFYTTGTIPTAALLTQLEMRFGRDNIRKFQDKIKDQWQIVESGDDVRILKQAFVSFTSLQHIQLLRVQDEGDSALIGFLRAYEQHGDQLRVEWAPACSHGSQTIVAALLTATDTQCSRFSSPMVDTKSLQSLQPMPTAHISFLAVRLTCLTLHFEDATDLAERIKELSGLFHTVFTAAKNMQAIHVGFPSYSPLELPMSTVFHNITWDRLVAFGVQGWKLDADEILDIAYRHKERLKGLRLRDVLMKDGSSWKSVLAGLRSTMHTLKWISLRRIGYAEYFDSYPGREIRDDLLSDTESDMDQFEDISSASRSTAAFSDDEESMADSESDEDRGPAANDMEFPSFAPDTMPTSEQHLSTVYETDELGDDGSPIEQLHVTTALFRRHGALRRFLPLILTITFLVLLWIAISSEGIAAWRKVPGPTAEQIVSGNNILPDLRAVELDLAKLRPGLKFVDSNANFSSPYPVGKTKAAGEQYTKTLVIASTKEENTTWVEPELGDLIEEGLLKPAIYVVNDRWAPLRPPKNKGHEASVYLSYIIDHYDKLSDVTIFMHAHQFTWHNNELHDGDAAQMVRDLSPQRVTRLGYMNMRCHFEPGCPDWLHPGEVTRDMEKQEQHIIAEQWAELFPGDAVPTVLSQACCAQFAVSKERILSLPKSRYIALRKWLYKTKLDDYISGRIFEYTWQYIFTKSPIDCPAMSACYCDGYGLCMDKPEAYQDWVDLRFHLGEMRTELLDWWEKSDLVDAFRRSSRDGRPGAVPDHLKVEPGRDVVLETNITETWSVMKKMRKEAYELGKDAAERARQAGRPYKEGDGY